MKQLEEFLFIVFILLAMLACMSLGYVKGMADGYKPCARVNCEHRPELKAFAR